MDFGAEKCRGEIIFFPDADMSFDNNLLKEVVEYIKKKKFDALYIPEVVVRRGIFWESQEFRKKFL